jgi:mono/diheme cytochrome c family protein
MRTVVRATLLLVLSLVAPRDATAESGPIDFRRDVLSILSDHCFACHGPDGKTRKGDLRLDVKADALRSKDPVVVPGKSGESELFARISSHDPDETMPPKKFGKPLTPEQIETLKRWIDAGAPWANHWAFEAPKAVDPPAVRAESWARNPIDRFVLARLEAEGLKPAPEADKATLIRRASLALTGLPPSLAEIDAFLADARPDAYERMVDRLLASPAYGERMALDWLDAARFADTNGFQNDFARAMWPWRDWAIAAFNRNLPFDQFVVEQIAGDLLPNATLEQKVATGFNRNNRTVTEGGSIEEEWRIENAVDRVETTGTVFLGLTIGCTRCHDHKFDPIRQDEFYQFMAFFTSAADKGVYNETRGNVPPLVSLPTAADTANVRRLDASIAATEASARDATIREMLTPRGLASIPFRMEQSQLIAFRREKAEIEAKIPTVMVMEDAPVPRETFVLKRGQYDQPDKTRKVEPGVPAALTPLPAGAPRNRLGLARWLVDPSNPLTARVQVNRIWQLVFGAGLVKTAENFGVQGEPPTHPALFDWLSATFVRDGWNLKGLLRTIVTSATFRQSSSAAADLIAKDPENRLLARGPRFRLPAEMVRDNALAVSGLLTVKLGGPSVKPYQPEGLWAELAGGAGEGPYVRDSGANLYRRSLYVYRKRTVPHPAMVNFDAPSREICQVKRPRTNTPLQALELLNDDTYVEAARRLAQLMLTEGGSSKEERLTYGFRRATARTPTPAELTVLRRGLDRYLVLYAADRDAAQAFIKHGDSPVPEGLDPAALAAYTAAAEVVLNLDESITQE